ncbi:MAG: 30S ribosomal protein S16, partial [Anaerolineae bacterium]
MVKIRLRRVGAKKQPSYRLVVTDSRKPRDGRFIEIIGHYNPRTEPPTVVVQEDRALYWLSVGAQPSSAVALFFKKLKLGGKLKEVHAGADVADVAEARVKISGPEETSKAAKREVAAAARKKKVALEKAKKAEEAAAAKAKQAEEAA